MQGLMGVPMPSMIKGSRYIKDTAEGVEQAGSMGDIPEAKIWQRHRGVIRKSRKEISEQKFYK